MGHHHPFGARSRNDVAELPSWSSWFAVRLADARDDVTAGVSEGCLLPPRMLPSGSRRSTFVCAAKKTSRTKESSTVNSDPEKKAEPWEDVDRIMLLLLLVESYSRQTGKPLMEGGDIANIARDIFQAPFCLLAHDYTGEEESVSKCTYANKAALEMMGGEWDDIVGQPSSLFEKDVLDRAWEEGHLPGLSAKVCTLDGSQIELQEVDIVNITSPSEEEVGQLILFDKWLLEDGTEVGPGYVPDSRVPSEEQIVEAQERVDSLAAHVRDLKENQEMKNDSPIVKEAVAELLQAKEALTKMQDLIQRAAEQRKEDSEDVSVE